MKNICLYLDGIPPVFSINIILSSITIPYFIRTYKMAKEIFLKTLCSCGRSHFKAVKCKSCIRMGYNVQVYTCFTQSF